jgi:hypothetical protein
MSTRATYLIKNADEWTPNTCLYIHHDGYLEGAACYFYNAFLKDGRINAESMIRGNEGAEITRSHDQHSDTEYRYTIEKNNLIAEQGHGDNWTTVFAGDWVDFINNNISSDWVDDIQPIKRVEIGYSKDAPLTPKMVKAQLDKELVTLGQWSVGAYADSPESANMVSLKKTVKQLQNLISKYGAPQWAI